MVVGWGCLLLVLCLLGFACSQAQKEEHYDLLIKDTTIVDGTGGSAHKGDVAIRGQRIAAVGEVHGDADVVIDGTGLITCPGFIDPHSHADFGVMNHPTAENLAMQGITTFVGGNCGLSPVPVEVPSFGKYIERLQQDGLSVNVSFLVGHNAVRSFVMGADFKRPSTPQELDQMKDHVEDALKNGALGLSVGLDYYPGEYAEREELVALAQIAGQHGGLLVPHLRHRNSHWPGETEDWKYGVYHGPIEDVWVGRYRGLWEALDISREANVPLHVAHLCNIYRIPQPHPDFLEEAAARATLWNIDSAVEEGYDVTFDVIVSVHDIAKMRPLVEEFIKSRTLALEPFRHMSREEFIKKINTPVFREKIRKVYDDNKLKLGMIHTKADPYWMNRFKIVVCTNEEYEGKTIGEIAAMRKTDPLEAIFDILVEDPDAKWFQYFDEKEVMHQALPVFLNHSAGMPSTDMGSLPPVTQAEGFKVGGSLFTPPAIAYGGFADYIGRYVRDRGSLGLEEAVRKATAFPAQRFGLADRGVLKPNAYADLVVFSLEKIKRTGDFMRPAQQPEGIEYVLVNGTVVYKEKSHTGARPGKVLRRNESQ